MTKPIPRSTQGLSVETRIEQWCQQKCQRHLGAGTNHPRSRDAFTRGWKERVSNRYRNFCEARSIAHELANGPFIPMEIRPTFRSDLLSLPDMWDFVGRAHLLQEAQSAVLSKIPMKSEKLSDYPEGTLQISRDLSTPQAKELFNLALRLSQHTRECEEWIRQTLFFRGTGAPDVVKQALQFTKTLATVSLSEHLPGIEGLPSGYFAPLFVFPLLTFALDFSFTPQQNAIRKQHQGLFATAETTFRDAVRQPSLSPADHFKLTQELYPRMLAALNFWIRGTKL